MANPSETHTSGHSPEQVAYTLLELIAYAEGKLLSGSPQGKAPDRKWILETYAECLRVVREP